MGVLIPTDKGCQPVDIPECGDLFMMGESILAAAYSGLIGFESPPDSPCAGSLETIVSLGQPSVDLCDALFVWLVNYGPSQRDSDRAALSAGGDLLAPQWIANWQVELWEAAYPTVEVDGGFRVNLPDPGHLHEINRLVYAHGYGMYHSTLAANTDGTLYPEGTNCEKLRFTNLTPLAPQGGCAGWVFQTTGPVPAFEG